MSPKLLPPPHQSFPACTIPISRCCIVRTNASNSTSSRNVGIRASHSFSRSSVSL
jgi:hypothetical protein